MRALKSYEKIKNEQIGYAKIDKYMKKLMLAITLILACTYGIPLIFNEAILLY